MFLKLCEKPRNVFRVTWSEILENEKDYTSYSDSEIITLEEVGPGLSDEAAINGLSNQLQKGLVTDQTRSQQSKGMIFQFRTVRTTGVRVVHGQEII